MIANNNVDLHRNQKQGEIMYVLTIYLELDGDPIYINDVDNLELLNELNKLDGLIEVSFSNGSYIISGSLERVEDYLIIQNQKNPVVIFDCTEDKLLETLKERVNGVANDIEYYDKVDEEIEKIISQTNKYNK